MTKTFVLLLFSLLCIISVHAAPKNHTSLTQSTGNEGCPNDYTIPDEEITGFTSIEKYSGQFLRRRWDLETGSIVLEQEVTNALVLTWTKDSTTTKLQTYATIAVEQEWRFGHVEITISYTAAKAVVQWWRFGRRWYHYERSAAGAVISEGNATVEDLTKYKQEIDCWCVANKRFFPRNSCAIYDN